MRKVYGRNYPLLRDSEEFKAFKETAEAKIHGIYEENMLEVDTATALADVDEALAGREAPDLFDSGHGAAQAIITLMADAQKRLAPMTIIKADDPSQNVPARAAALWAVPTIRKATAESLADSV